MLRSWKKERDVSLASLPEEKKPEEKAHDPLDACIMDVSDPEINKFRYFKLLF